MRGNCLWLGAVALAGVLTASNATADVVLLPVGANLAGGDAGVAIAKAKSSGSSAAVGDNLAMEDDDANSVAPSASQGSGEGYAAAIENRAAAEVATAHVVGFGLPGDAGLPAGSKVGGGP